MIWTHSPTIKESKKAGKRNRRDSFVMIYKLEEAEIFCMRKVDG